MHKNTIALFGEAEKGSFNTAYYFERLSDLSDKLGNPPEESLGLHYAVQALLYNQGVIYFRVKEEGYSVKDYLMGLKFLGENMEKRQVSGICLPGVGDNDIIQATQKLVKTQNCCLITTEGDLYDILSN